MSVDVISKSRWNNFPFRPSMYVRYLWIGCIFIQNWASTSTLFLSKVWWKWDDWRALLWFWHLVLFLVWSHFIKLFLNRWLKKKFLIRYFFIFIYIVVYKCLLLTIMPFGSMSFGRKAFGRMMICQHTQYKGRTHSSKIESLSNTSVKINFPLK